MKILVRNDNNLVDTVADNIYCDDRLRAEKQAYIFGQSKYYAGDYAIVKDNKIIGYIGHLDETNSTVIEVNVVPDDIFKKDFEGKQIYYTYIDGIYSRYIEPVSE